MAVSDLQQRFHSLGAERDSILMRSAPARHVREAIAARVGSLENAMLELSKLLKTIERPLFEIDQERARLARALSGQTGASPPREVRRPPMTDAQVAEVVRSLRINDAVQVQVSAVAEDARIEGLVRDVAALSAQIEALKSGADHHGRTVEVVSALGQRLDELERAVGAFADRLEEGAR